ncbi:NUDIX hydrolase [Actinomadura parmotrematis]|uniref:NUDIX domain-containing protein n=1 Tax=Actinomadura parmotrematis TaxID=2864039 RepID=A0ABS7G2J7_9ACTN|nr:NUDIX domain-containing protein [Actinomadura parmotrematis]MBW8486099.1 NUDIX domain-containing protein [Actinomadura parmotrematis]
MAELDVVAWVHARDGRMLAVRSRGRDLLYLPGGKREPGEDDWTAVSREVREELGVELDRPSFRPLGVLTAAAHDQPAFARVRMACFASGHTGEFRPAGEIDELRYVGPADRALLAPASQAAWDLAAGHGMLRRPAR